MGRPSATELESQLAELRGTIGILENRLDQLDKHFDRIVQTIGLVGAAIAIVMPIVTVFFTGRSESSIQREFERFETVLDSQAEKNEQDIRSIRERVGLSYGEPNITLTTLGGAPISETVSALSIVETYTSDSAPYSSCSGANQADAFDEYALQLGFLIENSGNAIASIDVVRFLFPAEVFPDWSRIERGGQTWHVYDVFQKAAFFKELPGAYHSPYFFDLVPDRHENSRCEVSAFSTIAQTFPIIIEVYYHNQAGLSKTLSREVQLTIESP